MTINISMNNGDSDAMDNTEAGVDWRMARTKLVAARISLWET